MGYVLVYRCVITLQSPTIVSTRRTERGFFSELRYIPASTIGGSVNKYLLGSPSSNKPVVVCSPAYPLTDKGRPALPAHPFVYKCKGPEEVIFSSLRGLERPLAELVTNVRDIKEDVIKLECDEGHPVKTQHPRLVSLDGEKPRIEFQSIISIGMNRATASSSIGLFYEYEAISPGSSFIFHIAVLDESIDVNNLMNGVLRIGRGISRGMGRARVVDLREIDVRDEEERLRKGGAFPLYTLSPLLLSDGQGTSYNLLNEGVNLREHARSIGISEGVDGILVPAASDLKFLGSFSMHSMGYSEYEGRARPKARCLNPGSIVICKWSSPPSRSSLSMVYLKYVGLKASLRGVDDGYLLSMLAPFLTEPLEEVFM